MNTSQSLYINDFFVHNIWSEEEKKLKDLKSIRTDLAIEAAALYNKVSKEIEKIDGVEIETEEKESIKITRVNISNKKGEDSIGKKKGNYITIESPKIRDNDEKAFELTSNVLSNELKNVLNLKEDSTVLAVGLGNWNVTPDALGPKVISNLMITRHLFEYIPEFLDDGTRSVCAISPGVLGLTGIETSEIIKGIVDKVKPDVIIAIDALASRKTDRISTTIQIADTGIAPGSGIGNKRKSLDKEYLGVPVIAIGVPTVVDAATVANDAIELLIENIKKYSSEKSNLGKLTENFDFEHRYPLIKEVLTPYVGDLIVTPKEVDGIIEEVSKIIANGINDAVLGAFQISNMQKPM